MAWIATTATALVIAARQIATAMRATTARTARPRTPMPARVDQAEPVDPPPAGYPQVIVVQGREQPSWLRDHAGHLIAAAGADALIESMGTLAELLSRR